MEEIVRRIKNWLNGNNEGPLKLQLNPTDHCNLNCVFCWLQDKSKVDYSNQITKKRYMELIVEAVDLDVKFIQITGGGEPLMRKDVTLSLMKKIKEKGIKGSLITNGTLFIEEDIKNIINIDWDEVIFSLDSPNEETHDILRGKKGAFKKTTDAIKKFDELKIRMGKDKPKICVHFVLTNKNFRDIPNMIKLLYKINCRNFFIEPLVVVSEVGDSEKLKLSRDERKEFRKYLKKAIKLCRRYHIENNLENFLNREIIGKTNKMDKEIAKNKGKKGIPCFEPWYNIIIRPNGRVGPCCMFDFSGEYVHNKSLSDIWFGEYFSKIRENLKKGKLMGYCKKCNPSQVIDNIKIRNIIENVK
jgi:MoaA/NifB/PqqE/SkfB family radical SAM enzyme